MEFTDQAEADSAWAEIADAKFNTLDPRHKEIHSAMTRFYQRQYPGPKADDNVPPQLNEPPPAPQQAGAEQEPVPAATAVELRNAWGNDYDKNMTGILDHAEARGADMTAAHEFAHRWGFLDDPELQAEAIKLLHKAASKRR